jgi:esterase/lipase
MPTLTVQVKKDWRTTVASIQEIHDNIPNNDKKMLWIEDVEERLEGYNYFAKKPKELIEWLDNH